MSNLKTHSQIRNYIRESRKHVHKSRKHIHKFEHTFTKVENTFTNSENTFVNVFSSCKCVLVFCLRLTLVAHRNSQNSVVNFNFYGKQKVLKLNKQARADEGRKEYRNDFINHIYIFFSNASQATFFPFPFQSY